MATEARAPLEAGRWRLLLALPRLALALALVARRRAVLGQPRVMEQEGEAQRRA